MSNRTYTLPELERLWNEYAVAFATRWLIAGDWAWVKPEEKGKAATRAERVKIKDHKTFIEYLKEKEK